MTDPRDANPPEELDQLMSEASMWFARMRGPDADLYKEEFDAWLKRGAVHLGAYNRAAELFTLGNFLADEKNGEPPAAPSGSAPSRRFLVLLCSAFLVTIVAVVVALQLPRGSGSGDVTAFNVSDPAVGGNHRLASASDKRQRFSLEDGSRVTLEPDSQLEVGYDATIRRVRLDQGSARFEVAQDPRQFVVEAGGGTVTALGTIFDVAIENDASVTVRLIEGLVEVAVPARGGGAAPVNHQLRPGDAVSYPRPPRSVTASEKSQVSGASNDQDQGLRIKEYADVPLSVLIADANAGSRTSIRLADPTMGTELVSGRFRVSDATWLADRLAALLDLTVDRGVPNEIVLRSK